MRQLRTFLLIALPYMLFSACSKDAAPETDPQDPPPLTWQENWFEHKQLLKLQYYNQNVALYYDDDMDSTLTWPRNTAEKIWKYTWNTYGGFGQDSRLKVILHADKYGGGHPAYYMSPDHGYNNTIDIGLNKAVWKDSMGEPLDLITHETGHIVEGNSYGILGSPAFNIWGDSKWMEIFQYDVYKALGWADKAKDWHNRMLSNSDDFPRAGTHWYRDWFYPIYAEHGEVKVLNNFFKLLSENFPTEPLEGVQGKKYTRDMNMGEFIHFWSGAAAIDLSSLAKTAFGDKDRNGALWKPQLEQAKIDFPKVTY